MENSESIRKAHNQVAENVRNSALPYHFIGYTFHSGKVYELDGLKSGPSLIAFLEEGKDWFSVAKPKIISKINMLLENNFDFHVFSLISDRKEIVLVVR